MIWAKGVLMVCFVVGLNSCQSREGRIMSLLQSDEPEKVIKGCNLVNSQTDSVFVSELLSNPFDMRITHSLRYKGISVYEAKMSALGRIFNCSSNLNVNDKLDSSIALFYIERAKEEGFIDASR